MISGGQTCNQEAAVQQTFSLVRSSFFYLQQWLYGLNAVLPCLYFAYNCTKHSPTQLLSSRSEATPHEMKSSLSSCKSVWTRDRLVVFSGLQSVLKRVVDWTTRKTSSLFFFLQLCYPLARLRTCTKLSLLFVLHVMMPLCEHHTGNDNLS